MKLPLLNIDGNKSDSIEVSDKLIKLKINYKLIKFVIDWQFNHSKPRTAKTKQRNSIRGSTKKIVAQKGSGGRCEGSNPPQGVPGDHSWLTLGGSMTWWADSTMEHACATFACELIHRGPKLLVLNCIVRCIFVSHTTRYLQKNRKKGEFSFGNQILGNVKY